MQPRQLFSDTLELNATAAGDTFTLVQVGDVVDLYHNQPTTGTPEVPVADLSAIAVNGNAATTVNVDLSGGNPIPAVVSVDSGTVSFNQNFGADEQQVDLNIASGATAKFDAAQSLATVDLQRGGTFTTVISQAADATGLETTVAPVQVSISPCR